MSRNDANDYAQRLYARVPAYYRVLDEEQGMPLYALLATVGEQVANIRADLDALWDDFFIETCEDWVVPYLAALTGTNLLANPVGQSNRLDVRNTVMWRRSKGTPAMLRALASSVYTVSAFTGTGCPRNGFTVRRRVRSNTCMPC